VMGNRAADERLRLRHLFGILRCASQQVNEPSSLAQPWAQFIAKLFLPPLALMLRKFRGLGGEAENAPGD
jgi:hypothetical protein